MTTPKLKRVLSILCVRLSEKQVPHAIIGAMALSLYGMPRFTALLKLMAIANNSDRKARDMADLEILFKSAAAGFLYPAFKPIDIDHLQKFAARFHVSKLLGALLPLINADKKPPQEIEKQNG